MKRLMILTIGVCLLLTSVPVMADQAADEAAIRKVIEERIAADNAKDVKAFAALHIESFEFWGGNIKGRDAVEKSRVERCERQKALKLKTLDEIGITFVTPEVAIYKGRMEYTGWLDDDGKTVPPTKRLVARVLVKKDGQWLIAATFGRDVEE